MNTVDRYGILFVDDEVNTLKYFRAMFESIAPIYTAANADEALELFQANSGKIGVVLSDKRMPGTSGIDLLEKVRSIDSNPLRILVTAYSDLELAVKYLNDGLLYSYLTKPWDPDDLKGKLNRALDRYWICQERSKLLKERARFVREMVMAEKASNISAISIGLNHHLRNSMAVIQGFFDMLPVQVRDEIGGEPKDQFFWTDYYRNVEEHISRVNSFITSLAEESISSDLKLLELEIEPEVDLVEMIEHFGGKLGEGEGGTVEFSLSKTVDAALVSADRKRVGSAIQALLEEARKNIDENGLVEVELDPMDWEGRPSYRLLFCDNGPPLIEEERERLFDPFFVRPSRPADPGNGLLSTYLTVYYHGGTVRSIKDETGRNIVEMILPVNANSPVDRELAKKVIEDVS